MAQAQHEYCRQDFARAGGAAQNTQSEAAAQIVHARRRGQLAGTATNVVKSEHGELQAARARIALLEKQCGAQTAGRAEPTSSRPNSPVFGLERLTRLESFEPFHADT